MPGMQQAPATELEPSFAPRGMLMAGAFGGAVRRSITRGLGAAVVVAGVVGVATSGGPLAMTIVIATAGAIVAGLAVAILVFPRRARLAFEAYSWLGRRELNRFHARTASSAPADPAAAAAWISEHPRSPATATARIELLAMLDRIAEAEAELALLPPPADDDERVEQAGLRTFVTFVATGRLEQGDLEALAGGLDPRSGAGREAATILALGEARLRRDRDDPSWPDPLIAVRPALGSDAFRITFRDTWSRAAGPYGVVGVISGGLVAIVAGWLGG